jgi:hypothetical protein
MEYEKINKFHKIVTVELLSTIDHKLRGVQQFIVAFRGLIEEDILNDLDEEVNELQALYEPYLKLRNLKIEEEDVGKFIEDNYNVQKAVSCIASFDRDKLRFVFDFLVEFSEENYELSLKSSEKGCFINFVSPAFSGLTLEDFRILPEKVEKLPFFALRKTLDRMGAEFSIEGEGITIELINFSEEES